MINEQDKKEFQEIETLYQIRKILDPSMPERLMQKDLVLLLKSKMERLDELERKVESLENTLRYESDMGY